MSSKTNNNNNIKYVKKTENEGIETEEEILFKTKKSYRFEEQYLTFFQGMFLEEIIHTQLLEEAIGPRALLLFFLMSQVKTDNTVRMKQTDIAKALKMKKQNVSKYLKILESIKIIEINNSVICFSQHFLYKGKVKNHSKTYWQSFVYIDN